MRDRALACELPDGKQWNAGAIGHGRAGVVEVNARRWRHMIEETATFIPSEQNECAVRVTRGLDCFNRPLHEGYPISDFRNVRALVLEVPSLHVSEIWQQPGIDSCLKLPVIFDDTRV